MSDPETSPDIDESPQPSERLRRVFRLVFGLMSLAFALALGELALRVLHPEVQLQRRSRDAGLFVPFEPGQSADLLMDEFRVRYDINAFGYRDRLDRQLAASPEARRVLVLGDSFTAGYGVAFEEIYATRIEEATGVEMINAGKNGGCALWYLWQARYAAPRFGVDGLVVQIFDNDLADLARDWEKYELPEDGPGEVPAELGPALGLSGALSKGLNDLYLRRGWKQLRKWMKGEALFRNPYVRVGAYPEVEVLTQEQARARFELWSPPDWPADFAWHEPSQRAGFDQAFARHRRCLAQLITEAKARGERVALLYIPCQQVFDGRAPAEIRASNPLSAQLAELCEEEGALLVDVTEPFAAREDPRAGYYAYDGHLNAQGQGWVAEALALRLREAWPEVFGSGEAREGE